MPFGEGGDLAARANPRLNIGGWCRARSWAMGRRKILKVQDRQKLFDVLADEDSLIRHHSLTAADRLEIDLCRRDHNKLGFAVQLCVMRHPGRVLAAGEIPPRRL
jgi:TnpA family transposase